MPADHETIRIWGLHGRAESGDFYLFREVLGGGGPGRPWADGSDVVHIVPNSRNLPAEFSETRYPIRIERLGLNRDSGGAGYRRGGLGYDKRIRVLEDSTLLSNADRAMLNTYGVNGGEPGTPYAISVTVPGGDERQVAGMADGIEVKAGSIVRIATTGGGGWGDALRREPATVCRDVESGLGLGRCSPRALRRRRDLRGRRLAGRRRGDTEAESRDGGAARAAPPLRPGPLLRGPEGRGRHHLA